MRNIFSPEGIRALTKILDTPCAIAFDYDGTLAKIVRDREKAKITPTVKSHLKMLTALYPTVIISGRSLKDLKLKFPDHKYFLIGNHGLETNRTSRTMLSRSKAICRNWISQLKTARLEIEDKTYSLSIHYRKAKNRAAAEKYILKIVRKIKPKPQIVKGKCVINLLPFRTGNKGHALSRFLNANHLKSALYVGDDDTDESVFSLRGNRILGIRVGQGESNAPFFLPEQKEILNLLKILLRIESHISIKSKTVPGKNILGSPKKIGVQAK